MMFSGHDLSHEDLVVTTRKNVRDRTIEERQAISQDR